MEMTDVGQAKMLMGMEAWGDITTRAETFPMRRLSAAILGAAVNDWRRLKSSKGFHVPSEQDKQGYFVNKREMMKFFRSDWFVDLCDVCDIDFENFLRKLGVMPNKKEPYWKWKSRERRAGGIRNKEDGRKSSVQADGHDSAQAQVSNATDAKDSERADCETTREGTDSSPTD